MLARQRLIAGVDEAGRGAWAGPLVAAAVIMPKQKIRGVRDSKQLTPKQRADLFPQIIHAALTWSVVSVSVDVIDRLGVHQANLFALSYCITHLGMAPDRVLVDGFAVPHYYPTRAVIHGDQTEYCIAAASIVAKVTRDQIMCQLHKTDDRFGYAQHKGYGTALHLQRLQQYGSTDWHRQSFAPIRKLGI